MFLKSCTCVQQHATTAAFNPFHTFLRGFSCGVRHMLPGNLYCRFFQSCVVTCWLHLLLVVWRTRRVARSDQRVVVLTCVQYVYASNRIGALSIHHGSHTL